jgi:coenzyme F420-dependent glucose-6-phosphate dehydrogenase
MRTVFGFHCSHEQHAPSALLKYARRAAEVGFTAAMCSDHFHPWSERQAHSGSAWSWLGAALEATSLSFGTVCAPGQRYHPAVIAQAAATLCEMYPRRFWLAVGSGEALNESITGSSWPPKRRRNARLQTCAEIMRALWAGETVRVRGAAQSEARLYSRPATPPLLLGAALSPETAGWMGSWADGLIMAGSEIETLRRVSQAFRDGGGAGKPLFLQVTLSFAPSQEEAERAAYDQWRHCVLDSDQLSSIASPEQFDRACENAHRSAVLARVRASSDIRRHVDWLLEAAEVGLDRIYVHNVARQYQHQFLDACAAHLLPKSSSAVAQSFV